MWELLIKNFEMEAASYMFKKIKRCCKKTNQNYQLEVQCYLKNNAFILVKKISEGVLGSDELKLENVQAVLGDEYPINPCIPREDIVAQFVSIFEQAGYVFCQDSSGNVYFKQKELYSAVVQNHLKFSGKKIFERLADCCQKTNGRIRYEEMHEILGFHYPKAPYALRADYRVCIILFLRESGIPFKYDEKYIYLP